MHIQVMQCLHASLDHSSRLALGISADLDQSDRSTRRWANGRPGLAMTGAGPGRSRRMLHPYVPRGSGGTHYTTLFNIDLDLESMSRSLFLPLDLEVFEMSWGYEVIS